MGIAKLNGITAPHYSIEAFPLAEFEITIRIARERSILPGGGLAFTNRSINSFLFPDPGVPVSSYLLHRISRSIHNPTLLPSYCNNTFLSSKNACPDLSIIDESLQELDMVASVPMGSL